MDIFLQKSITLGRQLEELYDEDYLELSKHLNGDLYDSYKELVLKEKGLLREAIEIMLCIHNNN